MKRTLLTAVVAATALGGVFATAFAAPLPNNSTLSVTQGLSPALGQKCTAGSCFSMEVAPQFFIWTDFGPGKDGGVVVGKNQLPGGQETGPSVGTNTPGDLTAAWFFFGNYGTFATAPFSGVSGSVTTDASANLYDDASCTSAAACIGKTTLGTWHVAWNGVAVPMGSSLGCLAKNADGTTATQKCLGVTNWQITPDGILPGINGDKYVLDYAWAVPNADPSGFGNVAFGMHMTGTIKVVPIPAAAWLFGSGLVGLAAVARRKKKTKA